MAYIGVRQYIYTDLVIDPRDVMVNINEVAKEMNGFLDRDNVDELAITPAKVATGALNTLDDVGISGTPAFTLDRYATGQWTDITGLSKTAACTDGVLRANGWVAFQWDNGVAPITRDRNDRAEFRLLVDGAPVAYSGWFHYARTRSTCSLTGYAPVDSGDHVITMQVRAYAAPWTAVFNLFGGLDTQTTAFLNTPYTLVAFLINKGRITYRHGKR